MDMHLICLFIIIILLYNKLQAVIVSIFFSIRPLFVEQDDDSDEELSLIMAPKERRRIQKIENYVETVIVKYNSKDFQGAFRISKEMFNVLLGEIEWPEHRLGRRQIPHDTQLYSFLWLMANQESFRSIAERFNISKSSLSNIFVRLVNGINKLVPKYIQWPKPTDGNSGFRKFTKCIGAIDGTYVPCACPADQVKAYTNRKSFESMTLQAICNGRMQFIHVYAGWPSSVPDIRIFKNSDIFRLATADPDKYFPDGTYLLADKAYPVLSWCITPFMQRRELTDDEIQFNYLHSSDRTIVERSFALLFGRMRRLRYLDMKRIDWLPQTIIAACVIHNLGILHHNEIENFVNEGLQTRQELSTVDETSSSSEANEITLEESKQLGLQKREELVRRLTGRNSGREN